MKRAARRVEESDRRRIGALTQRFELPAEAATQLEALIAALAIEPAPPTTMRDPAEAIDGHLADSLVALELACVRAARTIADVGAGAGFPGLPLAVALPGANVDLIEPATRKVAIIERLAAAARAANARALTARAEELAREAGAARYELVVARAVARLPVVAEYAAPLLADGGSLVAWTGRSDRAAEAATARAAADLGLAVMEIRRVAPFAGARSRHLQVLRKVAPTPARFPRRTGVAARRPLG